MHTILVFVFIIFQHLDTAMLQKASGADNPSYYNIGGVLSSNESETHFATTIAVR